MSNIEEDIKILEKFNPGDEYTEKIKIAIENILAERKQDKARIQELEEENRIYALEGNRVKLELYIKENHIQKQKVKEGLEDIEDYFDRLNGPDEDIEYIRNIKKELLEESK